MSLYIIHRFIVRQAVSQSGGCCCLFSAAAIKITTTKPSTVASHRHCEWRDKALPPPAAFAIINSRQSRSMGYQGHISILYFFHFIRITFRYLSSRYCWYKVNGLRSIRHCSWVMGDNHERRATSTTSAIARARKHETEPMLACIFFLEFCIEPKARKNSGGIVFISNLLIKTVGYQNISTETKILLV